MAGLIAQCVALAPVLDGHGGQLGDHLARLQVFEAGPAGRFAVHGDRAQNPFFGRQYGMRPAGPQALVQRQVFVVGPIGREIDVVRDDDALFVHGGAARPGVGAYCQTDELFAERRGKAGRNARLDMLAIGGKQDDACEDAFVLFLGEPDEFGQRVVEVGVLSHHAQNAVLALLALHGHGPQAFLFAQFPRHGVETPADFLEFGAGQHIADAGVEFTLAVAPGGGGQIAHVASDQRLDAAPAYQQGKGRQCQDDGGARPEVPVGLVQQRGNGFLVDEGQGIGVVVQACVRVADQPFAFVGARDDFGVLGRRLGQGQDVGFGKWLADNIGAGRDGAEHRAFPIQYSKAGVGRQLPFMAVSGDGVQIQRRVEHAHGFAMRTDQRHGDHDHGFFGQPADLVFARHDAVRGQCPLEISAIRKVGAQHLLAACAFAQGVAIQGNDAQIDVSGLVLQQGSQVFIAQLPIARLDERHGGHGAQKRVRAVEELAFVVRGQVREVLAGFLSVADQVIMLLVHIEAQPQNDWYESDAHDDEHPCIDAF